MYKKLFKLLSRWEHFGSVKYYILLPNGKEACLEFEKGKLVSVGFLIDL